MRTRAVVLALALLLTGCGPGGETPGRETPVGAAPAGSASPGAAGPGSASASPGTPRPTPTFTDVSRGDTDSIVMLHRFTPGKRRAVVVEPVIFLKSPEYCETYGIPEDDKRCQYAWNTRASGAKITLPRADDAVLAVWDHDDPMKCMDDLGAGTCEVSAQAFDDRFQDSMLIRLTTKDGVAVRLAELYLP